MIKLFKVVETSSRPLALQGIAKYHIVGLETNPSAFIVPVTGPPSVEGPLTS
jgi:hypothetical protein